MSDTPDYAELREDLREGAMDRSAQALTAIETLLRELEAAFMAGCKWEKEMGDEKARADALEKQVGRLREALAEIEVKQCENHAQTIVSMRLTARAALAGEEEG